MDRTDITNSTLLLELRAARETLEAIVEAARAGADAVVLEAIA